MLRQAANSGNAQAALDLGMTFDPAFLAKWGAVGFTADVAQAREWYKRASNLGSTEAARRLEQLTVKKWLPRPDEMLKTKRANGTTIFHFGAVGLEQGSGGNSG